MALLARLGAMLVTLSALVLALATLAAGPSTHTYLPLASAGTDVFITSPRWAGFKGGGLWRGSIRNLSSERVFTVTLSISTDKQENLIVEQGLPAIFPGQASSYSVIDSFFGIAAPEIRIVSIHDVPVDLYAPLQIDEPELVCSMSLYDAEGYITGLARNTTGHALYNIRVGHAPEVTMVFPGTVQPGEAMPFRLQLRNTEYCRPRYAPPLSEPLEPFADGLAAVGKIAP